MKKLKESKKAKVNLDEGDYQQGLDYSYVMMVAYFETLSKCKVIQQEEVAKAFEKVGDAMGELYQTIGRLSHE